MPLICIPVGPQEKVAKLYRKFRGPLMLKYLKELAANDQAMAMCDSIFFLKDLEGSRVVSGSLRMSFISLILATNSSLAKLPPEADTMTMSAFGQVSGWRLDELLSVQPSKASFRLTSKSIRKLRDDMR